VREATNNPWLGFFLSLFGDGRLERILKTIARMDVLIIDDWGLAVLTIPERRDLLKSLEDRHGRASTIVTSQLPVEHWFEAIGDPALTDAILDRVRHYARTNGAPMAHSTTPTGSNLPEKACEKPPPATQPLTCQPKPERMKPSVKPAARLRVEWLPAMPWNGNPP